MIELLLAAERMLAVGHLDQAERLFRQVAEADPRNAIAVVGLARVALERGDEPYAMAEARRALEIDPENVAARRMLDRLEEVIATREAAPATTTLPQPALATEPDRTMEEEPELEPTPPARPPAPPEPVRAEPRPSLLDRLLRFLRLR